MRRYPYHSAVKYYGEVLSVDETAFWARLRPVPYRYGDELDIEFDRTAWPADVSLEEGVLFSIPARRDRPLVPAREYRTAAQLARRWHKAGQEARRLMRYFWEPEAEPVDVTFTDCRGARTL